MWYNIVEEKALVEQVTISVYTHCYCVYVHVLLFRLRCESLLLVA